MKALHRLSNLDVSFVSLVSRAAVRDPSNPNEPMRFLLTKGEQPVVDMTPGGATTTTGGHHMPDTEAELRAALEKAELENAELREQIEKAGKSGKKGKPAAANNNNDDGSGNDDAPEGDATVSKAEKVAKAELERVQKEADERVQKAEADAAEAMKIAKAEQDRRILGEHVEFAKSELPHMGDPTELGGTLHKLEQALSKEDYDAHVTGLRAANEQIAKGDLFKQYGKDGSPTAAGGDDVEKVRKHAADLRKADPGLSATDALKQAIHDNPDLVLANR